MDRTYFEEEQRFRQPWLLAVVLVCFLVSISTLYLWWTRGGLAAARPGTIIAVLAGFGVPALFWWARLLVIVEDNRLHVRFRPFLARWDIPVARISRFEATGYHPLLEYGGWGVRWRPGRGRAYNVSGNRGVKLTLSDGEELLIGSQRAEELEAAIARAKSGDTK